MMFFTRSFVFSTVAFVLLTVGHEILKNLDPVYFTGYLAIIVGLAVSWILAVYEGE